MIQWSCFINDTSQSYTVFCIVPSLQSIKYWQSVTLLYLDWTNTLTPLISFIILCFQEIRKLVSRTSDESPEYSQWVKRQSFQKWSWVCTIWNWNFLKTPFHDETEKFGGRSLFLQAAAAVLWFNWVLLLSIVSIVDTVLVSWSSTTSDQWPSEDTNKNCFL